MHRYQLSDVMFCRKTVGCRCPFGAFLSGGIDSSAVVGLMSQVMTQPVNTFSVIFEDKSYSEELYSRRIAKRFNTRHQEIFLNGTEIPTYYASGCTFSNGSP